MRKNLLYLTIGVIGILMIGLVGLISIFNKDDKADTITTFSPEPVTKPVEEEKTPEEPVYFFVDIKGEVKTPGVYKLEAGKRVIDVINLAGGLTKNASTKANNLSLRIEDEMVIIIYSNNQIKEFITTKEEEKVINDRCSSGMYEISNDSCIKTEIEKEESNPNLININTATINELTTLDGVGEKKAQDIIDYRTSNGNFKNIDELLNVSGIGESLFEKIKNNITV